jgi:rubrerythrin
MNTRQLLELRQSGHAGMNSLFSKAHSMGWDLDRDVDWELEIRKDDPGVDPSWAPFGRTPTFQALPREVQVGYTRQALCRMLNILQVGESVAQDVCAKLALLCEEEDYRNHAVAQAMDEARHHVAYARILEKLGDPLEEMDAMMEAIFDQLLASNDATTIIATEQFFLESLAMPLFERMMAKATNPLLRDVVTLIHRDEARHVAFGVLYVEQLLRRLAPAERLAFAQAWMPRILAMLEDRPGPRMRTRIVKRLAQAGAADPEGTAERMWQEQPEVDRGDREELASGRRVPHLLSSARRAGLLAPEILDGLGLAGHPLIAAALRRPLEG